MREKKFKPEQVWNCDESGFPHDPLKCRVVSVKGKTAYKVTCGARRENTTTLAVCSAAGRVLDPLIVFSGKNLQSTWRGDKALPGTIYGVSENGWMTHGGVCSMVQQVCSFGHRKTSATDFRRTSDACFHQGDRESNRRECHHIEVTTTRDRQVTTAGCGMFWSA